MNAEINKLVGNDPDGLLTYEYIANNIETCGSDMPALVENMGKVERNGQYLVSTARYLNAIDPVGFKEIIEQLIAWAIEKDREHSYIGALLPDIWGADYEDRAVELSAADNNFRRIYKRLFPKGF